MTDIVEVLTIVLKSMVEVETIIKLDGVEKKDYVINLLKNKLPDYEKHEEIIPIIIELVIILSRQKIPINLKKLETLCCTIF
jgi:hypothetical protein